MIEEDDWRLVRGQDECMQHVRFQYKEYKCPREGWDHDHCEFCWHKFMENPPEGSKDCSKQGFCSIDGKYWVCEVCFHDFSERFHFELVE